MIAVAIALVVMGVAIATIWTLDIVRAEKIDASTGRVRARDPGDGSPMLPHWVVEYGTAFALIGGGVGLLLDQEWSIVVAAYGAGMLTYTSVNSLGWVLADRSRMAYGVPMIAGAVVGIITLIALVAHVNGPA